MCKRFRDERYCDFFLHYIYILDFNKRFLNLLVVFHDFFCALLLMYIILVKLWVVYLIYTSQKFIWLIFYLNFSFAIKFNRQLSCNWKLTDKIICYIFWVMEIKRSGGFRRFFAVAFLLFLAPVESSNTAGGGQSNLT